MRWLKNKLSWESEERYKRKQTAKWNTKKIKDDILFIDTYNVFKQGKESILKERPRCSGPLIFIRVCLGSGGHCCRSQLFRVRQRWHTGCQIPWSSISLVALWINYCRVHCGGTQTGQTKTPVDFSLGANTANNEPHSSYTIVSLTSPSETAWTKTVSFKSSYLDFIMCVCLAPILHTLFNLWIRLNKHTPSFKKGYLTVKLISEPSSLGQ